MAQYNKFHQEEEEEESRRPHHHIYQQKHQNDVEHHKQEERKVGVFATVCLVSAMSGVETFMSFEGVYLMLMLQYLGTPVFLMSSYGIITGFVGIFLIPFLGYCSNRGSSPWRRKFYTVAVGLGTFLTGLTLYITASIIKLYELQQEKITLSNNFPLGNTYCALNGSHSDANCPLNGSRSGSEFLNTSIILDSPTATSRVQIPVAAVLGILGTSCFDVGYDVSTAIVRSFTLETLPVSQHSAALTTSTIVMIMGGTLVAVIGMFDLPGIIETAFGVDGVAGTLLLLCIILTLYVTTTFLTTMISGYIIGGWTGKRDKKNTAYFVNNKNLAGRYPRIKSSRIANAFKTLCPDREKTPLLSDDQLENPPVYGDLDLVEKSQQEPHDETHNMETPGTPAIDTKQINTQENPVLKNKSLLLTTASCFFGDGCLLAFAVYTSNALTQGIYGGDPLALPGTEGRRLYEKGLRTAALGNFFLYLSGLAYSLSSHKLINRLGATACYILVCAVVCISITALLVTRSLVAYFIMMAIAGTFRSSINTIPFILGSKVVVAEGGSGSNERVGRAISLLAVMMPTHLLLLSTGAGPLVDATDNVWVPVIYSMFCCAASGIILAFLYCFRHLKN